MLSNSNLLQIAWGQKPGHMNKLTFPNAFFVSSVTKALNLIFHRMTVVDILLRQTASKNCYPGQGEPGFLSSCSDH